MMNWMVGDYELVKQNRVESFFKLHINFYFEMSTSVLQA